MQTDQPLSFRGPIVFLLLSAILFLAYSNSFEADWHFDDNHVIKKNLRLHLTDPSPSALAGTLFASHDGGAYLGRLYRPLPCLTFGLNWLVGGDDVTGYHAVNLLIHILAATVLYLTILELMALPGLQTAFPGGTGHDTALLTAALWALHPIQTQAVTYIVQRMTSMAGLFALLLLYCYLRGRRAQTKISMVAWFFAACISYLGAIGSKENTMIMPLALVLVEMLFSGAISAKKRRIIVAVMAALALLLAVAGMGLFLDGRLEKILLAYDDRAFTLSERLMTEARVVVFYLSQLFFPVADRFSLIHDVPISRSLFDPPTTALAILFLAGLTIFAAKVRRRAPLVSFALLFFLGNHLVESTVLPLELLFEHRNYLPSMFLFLPASAAVTAWMETKKSARFAGLALVPCALIILAIGTYSRNVVWRSEESLWTDVLVKAPAEAYPYQRLANFARSRGDLDLALVLDGEAARARGPRTNSFQAAVANDQGEIYFLQRRYDRALEFFAEALRLFPEMDAPALNRAVTHMALGNWDHAKAMLEDLAAARPEAITYHNHLAFIHLRQGNPRHALLESLRVLGRKPQSWEAFLYAGLARDLLGTHRQAAWFLQESLRVAPDKLISHFALILNQSRVGDSDGLQAAVTAMLTRFGPVMPRTFLATMADDLLLPPLDVALLREILARYYAGEAENLLR